MTMSVQDVIKCELERILDLSKDDDKGLDFRPPSVRTVLVDYIGSSLLAALSDCVKKVLYVGSSYEGTSLDNISDHDLMLVLKNSCKAGWDLKPIDGLGPEFFEIIAPEDFKEKSLLYEDQSVSPKKVLKMMKSKVKEWQSKFKASTKFFHERNVQVTYNDLSGPSVPLTVMFTPATVTAAELSKVCLPCLKALIDKQILTVLSENQKTALYNLIKQVEAVEAFKARENLLKTIKKQSCWLFQTMSNLAMAVAWPCNCIEGGVEQSCTKYRKSAQQDEMMVEQMIELSIDLVPTLSLGKDTHGDKIGKDCVAKSPRKCYHWLEIDKAKLSTANRDSGCFKNSFKEKTIYGVFYWTDSKLQYVLVQLDPQSDNIKAVPVSSESHRYCELRDQSSGEKVDPDEYFSKLKKCLKSWGKTELPSALTVQRSPCRRALTVTCTEKAGPVSVSMIPVIRIKGSVYVATASGKMCWRESFSRKETERLAELNEKSPVYRNLLRIFKLLRYKTQELQIFPNYCFKNILLELSYRRRSPRRTENLSEMFLEMVAVFVKALESKELKQYYAEHVNLIADEKFTGLKLEQAKHVLTGNRWDWGKKVSMLLKDVPSMSGIAIEQEGKRNLSKIAQECIFLQSPPVITAMVTGQLGDAIPTGPAMQTEVRQKVKMASVKPQLEPIEPETPHLQAKTDKICGFAQTKLATTQTTEAYSLERITVLMADDQIPMSPNHNPQTETISTTSNIKTSKTQKQPSDTKPRSIEVQTPRGQAITPVAPTPKTLRTQKVKPEEFTVKTLNTEEVKPADLTPKILKSEEVKPAEPTQKTLETQAVKPAEPTPKTLKTQEAKRFPKNPKPKSTKQVESEVQTSALQAINPESPKLKTTKPKTQKSQNTKPPNV